MDLLPGLARKRFAPRLGRVEAPQVHVSRPPTPGLDTQLHRYSTDEHLAAGRVGAQLPHRDPPTPGLDRGSPLLDRDHAVRPTARSMNSAADQPNAVVAVAPSARVRVEVLVRTAAVDHGPRCARRGARASSGCPTRASPSTTSALMFTQTGPRHMRSGEKSGSQTATVGTPQGVPNSSRVIQRGHEALDDGAGSAPGEQRHAGPRPRRSRPSVPAAARAEHPASRPTARAAARASARRAHGAPRHPHRRSAPRTAASSRSCTHEVRPEVGGRRRQRTVEDRAVVEPRGVRMPVLRQPVVVEVGCREPPVLRSPRITASCCAQPSRQPAPPRATFASAQAASGGLVSGTGAQVRDRGPGTAQVLPVARRQVVARGEHAVLVHHVGQLPVGAREPEGELELLPREFRVAVAQADRDEVRVPLPEADVADLRRHDRTRTPERRELHDVGAEHPPAEGGHRLQVVAHDAGSGRTSRSHSASLAASVAAWASDAAAPTVRSAATSNRTAVVAPGASSGALGRRPGSRPLDRRAAPRRRREADGERRRAGEAERHEPPPNSTRCGSTPRDRQGRTVGVAHHQRLEHAAVVERPLVLRRVHAHAVALPEDEEARARQRERRLHEVEVVAGERHRRAPAASGVRRHRPPRPDAAMLFRMRRCPITNAMSIGIVASADAAITSP